MEDKVKNIDPTLNVQNLIHEAVDRIDDLRNSEVKRIDEKIDANDIKYEIQFNDAKEAVNTAFIAQEKAISAALTGTKEAIIKSDGTTDKRFDLLSEKIDGVIETANKNLGQSGLYVTQTGLTVALENQSNKFEIMLRPVITFMNTQTGKEGVTDPAIAELTKSVKDLVGSRSQGVNLAWVAVLGFLAITGSILGIVGFFIK